MKLITYDVDGTLYSLPRLRWGIFWRSALGLAPRIRRSEINSFLRMHEWIDQQRLLNDSRVDPVAWEAWKKVLCREQEVIHALLPRIGPRADALERLKQGRASGAIQVALSDLEARGKIQALGLSPYFDDAVSAESLGFWKPSPEPFRWIQKRYGVEPTQHLHVGDRDSTDGAGARAAGCRFVLI